VVRMSVSVAGLAAVASDAGPGMGWLLASM